jgi:outer membrane protein W
MRSHVARLLTVSLLVFVGSAHSVHAQGAPSDSTAAASKNTAARTVEPEASYFTVSAGVSWPVGGPVEENYQDGFTLGAAFRKAVKANYISGIEFAYGWYSLDDSGLADENPGSTFSGGDLGILSITTENDYLFGAPAKPMRPFLNLGIGYYKSFLDEATETSGSTTSIYDVKIHESSFFGFHAGLGAMINRDRFGLRLDVNYQHMFAGGPDLEFFTARGGLVFHELKIGVES